jgi:hypothetical protein
MTAGDRNKESPPTGQRKWSGQLRPADESTRQICIKIRWIEYRGLRYAAITPAASDRSTLEEVRRLPDGIVT